MNFEPDNALKDKLIQALTEKYNEEWKDIHVTDLVYCLREAYYRKTDPQPPTETELMFFVDGSRRHFIIEDLSGQESEIEMIWNGVRGTVDILDKVPIEIKTTRANNALPTHYFKQLGYYCAMQDSETGLLLIQRLNNREAPWEFWRVKWTPQEIKTMKNEILEKRDLLEKALKTNDSAILPKSDLLDDDGKPWKCRYCKYVEKCGRLY